MKNDEEIKSNVPDFLNPPSTDEAPNFQAPAEKSTSSKEDESTGRRKPKVFIKNKILDF